jgi:hypothetical protein
MLTILLDRAHGRLPILTVPRNEHTGDRDKSRGRRSFPCPAADFPPIPHYGGGREPSNVFALVPWSEELDSHGLEPFTFDSTTGEGSP